MEPMNYLTSPKKLCVWGIALMFLYSGCYPEKQAKQEKKIIVLPELRVMDQDTISIGSCFVSYFAGKNLLSSPRTKLYELCSRISEKYTLIERDTLSLRSEGKLGILYELKKDFKCMLIDTALCGYVLLVKIENKKTDYKSYIREIHFNDEKSAEEYYKCLSGITYKQALRYSPFGNHVWRPYLAGKTVVFLSTEYIINYEASFKAVDIAIRHVYSVR